MTTARLFYDDEIDAIGQMLASSGKSHKELAAFLFPDLGIDSAYAKLKACLSTTGDQRLRFGQVIAAMKFCGQYDPLYHACDETLHARPPRIAPEDEEVKLVEAINGAATVLNKAMSALERLRGPRSVRTGSVTFLLFVRRRIAVTSHAPKFKTDSQYWATEQIGTCYRIAGMFSQKSND